MADQEGKAEEVVEIGAAEQEATSEEPSSQGDEQSQPSEFASQLMKNPMVLAALQQKLGNMVGGNSGYIQSLPKVVKRRIKALKKIQFEATKIEAEFYREVHRLECEYAAKYAPLFEKRSTMVMGGYEPNDEEADWPSDDEKDDLAVSSSNEEVKNKASIEEKKEENAEKTDEKDEDVKGIPGFWLTIFKNVDMLSEMIQAHDEAILNHLQDVKVEFKEKDPMGFTLEFYFEPNDYFDNKKLTKEYTMRSEPDEADPFSFEGPEIVKCQGCKIDWKKGKNVTVKTVKKKQKHKASGTTRTISKTVQSDSFFNFFNPPSPPDDEEMDEDTEALLAADFEIGHFIRERIVPRAVLYFTGEALENDDEFEEGEEEDGAEEGEYDEDGDPDYNPSGVKYVSSTFHAHVAQLALGRVSQPSSAPPDTRLMLRPNTAASVHRSVHTHTDLPSRPDTAPIGSEGFNTSELRESIPKPKTNAFQDTANETASQYKNAESVSGSRPTIQESNASKVARPKSVNFSNTTVAVDHTGKSVNSDGVPLKNRKQESLTNALEPEKANIDVEDDRIGLKRETTFYDKAGGLSREKTFLTSGSQIGKGPGWVRNPELQPLVEVGTSEVEQSCDGDNTDENRKPPVPKLLMAQSGSAVTGVASQHIKKVQQKPDNVGNKRSENVKTKKVATNASTGKVPEIEKPIKGARKTAKDEARSILQRLMGKRGQKPHRAGQVPNVNRPVRKFTFEKPLEKLQEAEGVDRKPVSAPPGHGRGQSVPASRGGVHNRADRHKPASMNTTAAGVTDNRNLGIKPASAPANRNPPRGLEARVGTKPRAETHAKVPKNSQLVDRHKHFPNPKPQAGDFDEVEKREITKSGQREITKSGQREIAKSGQREEAKTEQRDVAKSVQREITKSGQREIAKTEQRDVTKSGQREVTKSGQREITKTEQRDVAKTEQRGVAKSGHGRGVRMQNAMIDSSLEASDPAGQFEEQAEGSMIEEDDLGGLHPKLRDSPYLKDNRLLAKSGKSRPSAGPSATRRGEGNPS